MRSMKKVALGLLAYALVVSCGSQERAETGVLVVPFRLGNQRSCEELGIVAVRGELDDGAYIAEVDCEVGQIRFAHLMPGPYTVALYGLDEDGVAVMDSLARGPQPIHVVGDSTTVVFEPALVLTAAPARIELRWSFGFGTCQGASIDGFSVLAWRADGSALLMASEVACSMAGEGRGQYRLVPDVQRELSGSEVGEVEIQAQDKLGFAIGEPVVFRFDSPGPGGSVRLSLSCDVGGCEGSGEPD